MHDNDDDPKERKVTWGGPAVTSNEDGESPPGDEELFALPSDVVLDVEEPIAPEDLEAYDEVQLSTYSGLNPRLKTLCFYFAQGMRGSEIAAKLGYTRSRVSFLLRRDDIRTLIRKYQNSFFSRPIRERMKELSSDAVGEMERILNDPNAKDDTKLRAATWILEKDTGKAVQTTQVESNTLLELFDKIDQLKSSGQIIDVSPQGDEPKQITPGPEGEEKNPDEPKKKDWDSIIDEEFSGDVNDKW